VVGVIVVFPFLLMNKDITTSLAVSKKLRENGWEQEECSHYWGQAELPKRKWSEDGTVRNLTQEEAEDFSYFCFHHNEENTPYVDEAHKWAAPTASEVLRELPVETNKKDRTRFPRVSAVEEWEDGKYDSLANAAAEMWIYLRSNGLLDE
jgi:hypothetical protein